MLIHNVMCPYCKDKQARITQLENELFTYKQHESVFEERVKIIQVNYTLSRQLSAALLILYYAHTRYTTKESLTDQLNSLHIYGSMTDNHDFSQCRVIINKLNMKLKTADISHPIESIFRVGYKLTLFLYLDLKHLLDPIVKE